MESDEAHYLHSSRREKILENLFIGEVLRELWKREVFDAELLQSDIDAAGYDLVLSLNNGMRYIQLKAMTKAKACTVNGKISDKPSGCVITMIITPNLEFQQFLWFGNRLGSPCDNVRVGKVAKHTKGNATGHKAKRKDSFRINKSQFETLGTIREIVDKLIEV